jgi:hypothetical protein
MIVVTMYIDDQTYIVNGRTYRRVLLRNSYRRNSKVCHDTIANLSSCSNEEIEAIKFAFANKNNLAKLIPDTFSCRNVNVFTKKKLVEERRNSVKTNS